MTHELKKIGPRLATPLFVFLALTTCAVHAEIRLPAVIGEHMVLQQGVEIPVWGWADPGEQVTVSFRGQTRSVRAGDGGRWHVTLSPVGAGGPFPMSIRGRNEITLEDVLVGEVWLCSGQSNMQFQLGSTASAGEEVPAAHFERIRFFTLPKKSSLEPLDDTVSLWKACTPETADPFSAVGYFFGREIHQDLGVPVGLINASWGGTNAEEWTDPAHLEREPALAPILDRWNDTSAEVKQLYSRPFEFDVWLDEFELLPARPADPATPLDRFEDGDLQNDLGGEWTDEWSKPRGRFSFGLDESAGALRVSGPLEVGHLAVVRLTFGPGPVDLGDYRGVRFKARGIGFLKFHSLQPSIDDWDNYATEIIEITPEWKPVTLLFRNLRQAGWGKQLSFTQDALSGAMLEFFTGSSAPMRPPGGLFNGMIRPLVPYALRGAIWYQGEGNAGRAYQYRKLLPTLIASWRDVWQKEFPFLIVQLPNFKPVRPDPSESDWAELREAQLLTHGQVPETGLAVTIDLGEADDVHPRRKKEVGRRLGQWALGTTYERKRVFSGPLYQSMRKEEGRIRIHFEHAGGGLEARGGGPLKGFAVAGADRKFEWAEARIEGESVVVRSDAVRDPVAARYAWADNPECNLYNREGFPASPFRTDQWKGVTADRQ